MKISEVIGKLQAIQAKYGDLSVIGGELWEDTALRGVIVVDEDGFQLWPGENSRRNPDADVGGVYLK